jgi:DNA polymerase-3 subunit delta
MLRSAWFATMTPDEALDEARAQRLRPIYLIVGEERLLQSQVVKALREAATAGGIAGLNEDQFDAGEVDAPTVIGASRTLPMMARRRLVLVRSIERWEGRDPSKETSSTALDRISEYAQAPVETTTLLLVGGKLDKRRRLYVQAQREGWLVLCEMLKAAELPGWIERRVQASGNRLARGGAELIAELCGPELGPVADAIDRVCLFAGSNNEVTEDMVAECIVRIRPKTVWELVGAVGKRDVGAALSALDQVYDPQDRGLRLVGVLAWFARQLIRFEAAIRAGLPPPDAAKAAGAAPFKARELAEQVKAYPRPELERWLMALHDCDLALKGGSKRQPKAILEAAIIEMCRVRAPREARGSGLRA